MPLVTDRRSGQQIWSGNELPAPIRQSVSEQVAAIADRVTALEDDLISYEAVVLASDGTTIAEGPTADHWIYVIKGTWTDGATDSTELYVPIAGVRTNALCWVAITLPTTAHLATVLAVSGSAVRVFASGSARSVWTLLRFNGTTWTEISAAV